MRCYICDVQLEPDEIREDKRTGEFLPCGRCMKVSSENLSELEEEDSE